MVLESYAPLRWKRLAITEAQGVKSGVPPERKIDRRFRPAQSYDAWETEALGQTAIVTIVRRALDKRLPRGLAAVREREAVERAAAEARLRKWR